MEETNDKKRTLRENSAIRHFTREFVGGLTSPVLTFIAIFSCYSKAFGLKSVI